MILRHRKNLTCRLLVVLACGSFWLWFISIDPPTKVSVETKIDRSSPWDLPDTDRKPSYYDVVASTARKDRPPLASVVNRGSAKREHFDYKLGPAVERAKYFSFQNRVSNRGHNRSDWELLTTSSCDAQGEADFLPTHEIQRLKLPQAILLGVQKGGTTALYTYFREHPDIDATEKELYFLDEMMDYFHLDNPSVGRIPRRYARKLYSLKTLGVTRRMGNNNKPWRREGLSENSTEQFLKPVTTTDGAMKQQNPFRKTPEDIMKRLIKRRENMMKNLGLSNQTVLDMTPNYMLHSDRVPARIKCIVPWAKLFVLLRNPVDRARSQYGMKLLMGNQDNRNIYGNPLPTFDSFVRQDIAALFETGVFQDWNAVDFETFWKSKECSRAWQSYIHIGLNSPVGMSIYALQIKPFLEMLSSMGRSDQFLAIDSQALKEQPDKTFKRLLRFLGLEPLTLKHYDAVNQAGGKLGAKKKQKHKHELSEGTLQKFQTAIAPYNRKLGDLLGDEWRDKWL